MNRELPLRDIAQKTSGVVSSEPNLLQEFFFTRTKTRQTAWADGKLDLQQQATQTGFTVRLARGGQQALASAQDFSETSVRLAWKAAREAIPFSQKDPAITFARQTTTQNPPFELDPALFKKSTSELKDQLKEYESKIKARDKRLSKVVRMGFAETLQEWSLLNTQGLSVSEMSTESSFGLELLAEESGHAEVAGRYLAQRFGRDLKLEPLIDQICEEAVQSLGAKQIPSGNYSLVFDPWVGCQFLEIISHGLCADQVQKGKSFFGRPQGQIIASELVTFIDDGLLQKGLNSSRYDDEGCPRRTTVVIQGGRFQHLLYDLTTATKDKTISTGNGTRHGLSRLPTPGASNFYLVPATSSLDQLMKDTPRGFLVQEVMGMHTADPISGDFSVGAQGRLIDGGKPTQAVRGVTLAGNLKKMLLNIDKVANDLTWYGSTGTPTFRVSQLTIGGT